MHLNLNRFTISSSCLYILKDSQKYQYIFVAFNKYSVFYIYIIVIFI